MERDRLCTFDELCPESKVLERALANRRLRMCESYTKAEVLPKPVKMEKPVVEEIILTEEEKLFLHVHTSESDDIEDKYGTSIDFSKIENKIDLDVNTDDVDDVDDPPDTASSDRSLIASPLIVQPHARDTLSPLRSDLKDFLTNFDNTNSKPKLSPSEARKYFGDPARSSFFTKCQWLRKQQVMALSKNDNPETKYLDGINMPKLMLFDDQNDIDASCYTNNLADKQNSIESGILEQALANSKISMLNLEQTEQAQKLFDTIRSITPDVQTRNKCTSELKSPRSIYIMNCLAHRMNPRASLVIRKKLTQELDLQHYGMGDDMAMRLAESLQSLPFVNLINISDNNLTDVGMKPLLRAIVKMPNILYLNLSENDIDQISADALADYLGSTTCTLQKLILRKADINDHEGAKFVKALRRNSSLLELDMSENLLGHAEMLNTVQPDVITAPEAIASLLRLKKCKIQTLKLAWNLIRLQSAEDLCRALNFNKSLTYIDLSYNALGPGGGKVLGDALLENKTLQSLFIDNNNIDSSACFVLCVGVVENVMLRKLSLNGNPVGDAGCKALMKVPTIVGSRIDISASSCNFGIRYADFWFDEDYPCRAYKLDMTDLVQRAIAFKLLHVVANHPTYIFAKSSYEYRPGKGEKGVARTDKLDLIQSMLPHKLEFLDQNQRSLLEQLFKLKESAKNPETAIKMFKEYDVDGSGEIDKFELFTLCRNLGMNISESEISDVMAAFDINGEGSIELPEFLSFVKNQYRDAVAKIQDIMEAPHMVLRSSPSVKYTPPRVGILYFDVVDSFMKKKNYKVLTTANQVHITSLALKSGGELSKLLSYAFQSSKIRINEAIGLYNTMLHDMGDKAKVLSKILPQMALYTEARILVSKCLLDDRLEINRLKQLLGPSLRPIFGLSNGYYNLDLSRDTDRICLSRLLELCKTLQFKLKSSNLMEPNRIGDTSQRGDWNNFRNCLYNGQPFDVTIANFTPMKTTGKLEFDFSGAVRPLWGQTNISDTRLTKLLMHLHLIQSDQKDEMLNYLDMLKGECEYMLKGQGRAVYTCPIENATEIGLCNTRFYENLATRSNKYVESFHLEELKIDIEAKCENDNKKSTSLHRTSSVTADYYKRTASSYMGLSNDGTFIVDDSTSHKTIRSYGRDNTINMEHFDPRERNAIKEQGVTPSRVRRVSVGHNVKIALENNVAVVEDKPKRRITNANISHDLTTQRTAQTKWDQHEINEEFDKEKVITVAVTEEELLHESQQMTDSRIEAMIRFRLYMKNLLTHPEISNQCKSVRIIQALEDTVGPYWIRARHLACIVHYFHVGAVDKTAIYGTYRVEIVISLFSRLVDIHNFELVLRELSPYEMSCIYCRLGWLNIFNPMKPDGGYELNMACWEERQVAKALISLAVQEAGDNIIGGKFQWDRNSPYIPGWEITNLWLIDSSMSKKGFLNITYYSGEGIGLKGCKPDMVFRKSLLQMVLIDESEVRSEDDTLVPTLHDRVGEQLFLTQRDKWLNYLCPLQASKGDIVTQDTSNVYLPESKKISKN